MIRQGLGQAGMVIVNGGIVQRVQRPATAPAPQPPRTRPSLHLRTGDVIPAEVTGIDEEGVRFRTPISPSTFVAHDKVKAVEMAADESDPIRLNKSKRERLLTLPRMQKDSPPTHLIHARNGDYLRGRVVSLDGATLRVEVRLETKDVPRDRIGQIIWLHADELDASRGPAVPAGGERGLPVLALRSDGDRLTFFAEELADATLSGKSDVLGDCRVRLGEVDQLVFGAAISQTAAQLAFQRWKLQNAPEPKVAQDDAGGTPGRTPGTESALVGKPAPDFELDLMGGGKFRASASRGRILLLDFWATWCGPCIQAMPQVERIAQEFRDRGVQLVAVNLQEAPERIVAMLERHKLTPTVALDRDGAVAEKYGANAIPQTVIIDREGNVVRLFVGGGPHLGDQLKDALNALLDGKKTD
jgi:thiol-disulfide isomerase/thioredoxin